jgi:hypothetical protein
LLEIILGRRFPSVALLEGNLTDYLSLLSRNGSRSFYISILLKDKKSAHSKAGFFVVTVISQTGFQIITLGFAVWAAATKDFGAD